MLRPSRSGGNCFPTSIAVQFWQPLRSGDSIISSVIYSSQDSASPRGNDHLPSLSKSGNHWLIRLSNLPCCNNSISVASQAASNLCCKERKKLRFILAFFVSGLVWDKQLGCSQGDWEEHRPDLIYLLLAIFSAGIFRGYEIYMVTEGTILCALRQRVGDCKRFAKWSILSEGFSRSATEKSYLLVFTQSFLDPYSPPQSVPLSLGHTGHDVTDTRRTSAGY